MWALITTILLIINIVMALYYAWHDKYAEANFYLTMAVFLLVGASKE